MKYSIIVPVHNSASFVTKCLDSVKCQTFTDYELIIVCDRCTDNTADVVKPYADKLLFSDYGNDGGPRQDGIDAAEGEWILFLDDDDYWLHDYVLDIIDKSLSDSIDVLLFGFIFSGYGYARPIRKHNGHNIYWPSVWNKCYRRSFIDDTRFNSFQPSGNKAPDIDWTQRLLDKTFNAGILDQPLYYYNYMRPGSQTDTKVNVNGYSQQILW